MPEKMTGKAWRRLSERMERIDARRRAREKTREGEKLKMQNENTIEVLKAASDAAREKIEELLREREAWPALYQTALDSGDPQKVAALQTERERLENAGAVLKAQSLRAGIALREAKAKAAETEREAAFAALQAAEKKLKAAQENYHAAQALAGSADSTLRDLKNDNAAAKREFEKVMSAQLAPAAPVVRSIAHQTNEHFSAL